MRKLIVRFVLFTLTVVSAYGVQADQFFAVTFKPGPRWNLALPFGQQQSIDAHRDYWGEVYLAEILLMSGDWETDNGGLFILRAARRSEVDAIVQQDPLVKNGVIEPTVNVWRVSRSLMRSGKPLKIEIDPDQSFRLERLDPDSAIQLPRGTP